MPLTESQKKVLIYKGMQSINPKERKLVDFYELLWFGKKQVPTIEQAAKFLGYSQTEVNYFLTRRPVIKALEQRGIPWAEHSQTELTATQVATAITVMNFIDTRPMEEKLDQLGVNVNQYYAWLNDPQFKNLVQNLADNNLGNIQPTAIVEFTKLINKGDWQAVKYYLDTTGTMKSDTPQSEHLIKLIVEIIQRHVKDPEIIVAIANDIKLASANKTLEIATGVSSPIPAVIDAETINDARKQLGV